ncbi:hypothetical protein AYI69_g4383 [Smittium culicis]|uniref:Uncharacterized protein n=1 Tax=Smittium culicis TaxID=133412 RepID=A0A1R1YE40_9FUNG|nr:hypothetical protein AYI69_g4383 [Smittium culicis]
MLIPVKSKGMCQTNTQLIYFKLKELEFKINSDKSSNTPSQQITYLKKSFRTRSVHIELIYIDNDAEKTCSRETIFREAPAYVMNISLALFRDTGSIPPLVLWIMVLDTVENAYQNKGTVFSVLIIETKDCCGTIGVVILRKLGYTV